MRAAALPCERFVFLVRLKDGSLWVIASCMKKKKIVTIGGGTGSFTLLTGLKNYNYDLTAVVSMADDGGSTGVLRDELGVLPPGDVRQCLVALTDSTDDLRELMNYRFENGGLEGHNFGNLFLSALEKMNGSFSAGVDQAMKILNAKGRVVPVSEGDMRLKIRLNDGRILIGEKELDHNEDVRSTGVLDVALEKPVKANAAAVAAIDKADVIIIGPGDHYGSIMPNLLVQSIPQAIRKTRAKVIFIAPLTNKMGLTAEWGVEDYVGALEEVIGASRVGFVVVNSITPDKKILARYEKKEGKNSLVRYTADVQRHYKVVTGDILRREKLIKSKSDALAHTRAFIRHDSAKLARAVSLIVELNDFKSFDIL